MCPTRRPRRYFPAESAPVVSDPRVHMHYADGRYYLRTTGDRFDVILANVPDPQTAQVLSGGVRSCCLGPACTHALCGWTVLSEDDWRPVRRDSGQCARPADRADQPVLHGRVLSFRPRTPRAGWIPRLATAVVGGNDQSRPCGVPALHPAHSG